MPAKISTITYIHDSTERLIQDYMVKEIITVSRTDDNDVTKVTGTSSYAEEQKVFPQVGTLKLWTFGLKDKEMFGMCCCKELDPLLISLLAILLDMELIEKE
ncbi:hypothetical protein e19070_A0A2I1HGT4_9GLOM [Rhizophagus irregularis DAOM 181602=DAOM 197198]|nr:hypothetical protein e19070_A0A2I1HGT4_9GLOM [Rhizophagus irregularis DAOM 181602=DAOM 197198]